MKALIDGLAFESAEKVTILEAARRLGRPIPTLCHHPRLEPAAACRLCLVQVEGRREPVPACATALEDGQRIRTDTPELRRLRRGVLELILSEHPSACLVCAERRECREPKEGIRKTAEPTGCVLCPGDGRCRLQAVVEEVGLDRTAFPEAPRTAEPRRDDPLIDRDPGLCILCGLCVRVCRDLRGASVLTMAGRGGRTTVAAALDGSLLESGCRFCGACVDVCPTGALMERAVRHLRPDESKPLLCAWCGEGCLLEADLARGRLIGARPAAGPANRGQACVKGRFLIPDLLASSDRLAYPLVRGNGNLVRVSWEAALSAAAEGWRRAEGPFAAVGSDQDSCEDLRAIEALGREAFGSDRFSLSGLPTPLEALRAAAGLERRDGWPDVPNDGMAAMKAFLVFDEDLAVTAPLLGLEVFQSVRAGARLAVFGARESCLDRCARIHVRVGPESYAEILIEVAALLARFADGRDKKALAGIPRDAGAIRAGAAERRAVEEKAARIAALLEKRRPAAFLFGPGFVTGGSGPRNAAALWNLARLTGAALVPIAWGANARGAAELFDRPGPGGPVPAPAGRIFLSAYGGGPPRREGAFVVAAAAYAPGILEGVDVVLPRTLFAEQEGTWVNREGRVQRSRPVVPAPGEARPLWRIAAELARAAGRPLAWLLSADEILARIEKENPRWAGARHARPDGPPVFLSAARQERLSGFVPVPAAGAGGGETLPDPDDIHGYPAATALKSLRAVRRR